MKGRKYSHKPQVETGSESENHAFVLRYRREPEGPSAAQARVRIDLEYVNKNQRWRYSALDQALACITEIVDSIQPTISGPEAD